MRLIAPLLLLLLMFAGAASAGTDYYMSPSGNNASAGTSLGTAWATPTYAISQLCAGDTLYIVDGEYYDIGPYSFDHSGNATHWINVLAYNGTPILNCFISPTVGYGFTVYGTSGTHDKGYILIDGITIKNTKRGLRTDWAEYVIIKNCMVWCEDWVWNGTYANSGEDGISFSDYGGHGTRHSMADNCTVVNSGWNGIGTGGPMHPAPYGNDVDTYNITISNCLVHDNPKHNAFQVGPNCTDVVIENNEAYNMVAGGPFMLYFSDVPQAGPVRNITIRNNVFRGDTASKITGCIDCWVENNTFLNASGTALDLQYSKNTTFIDNYFNNTTYYGVFVSGADVSLINNTLLNTLLSEYRIFTVNQYGFNDGAVSIVNTITTPFDARVESNRLVEIKFTNGDIFTSSDESGAGAQVYVAPRYYSDKSNSSIDATTAAAAYIRTSKIYNCTLKPTSGYLYDVTINQESNFTHDITNLTVNSSVATNPTWINATMQNASANYSVSVDSSIVDHVITDSDGVVRYQYTSSWSSHTFEFNWVDQGSFSPDHGKSYYNAASSILNTVNSTGYITYDRTLGWGDTVCGSGSLVVTT